MLSSKELRQKYLEFFQSHGHQVIPSASLVPDNDPTVLFTTAGMHPLVPYLMGQKHPLGQRLTDVQKCIRTGDIDEVGDCVHHTFFEMLGNWSLGDYFKTEAIKMSFEFLTSPDYLNIPLEKLAVSVFAGDADAPFDQDSYELWRSLGLAQERIAKLPKKNNWWGPAGETGPCGPDTEMFYWTGQDAAPQSFDSEDNRWVEIWNDVFMQFNKTKEGKYEPLTQQNVDTGMGLERTLAILNGQSDNYRTDLFWPIITKLEELSGKKYSDYLQEFRIVADHLRAATLAIADGAAPTNKDRGYVVRRLIRRAIVKAQQLGIEQNFTALVAEEIVKIYQGVYQIPQEALAELDKEEKKFRKTLDNGIKRIESLFLNYSGISKEFSLSADDLFDLYQTYGFPVELSFEEINKRRIKRIDDDVKDLLSNQFKRKLNEHQEQSRTASAGMFKGGLADAGETSVKYHTATHLLLAALRQVLGEGVVQKGSNITAERLRLDFAYTEKMTPEQIKRVEDIVNEKIAEKIPVTMQEMPIAEAKEICTYAMFDQKYGELVKVYKIGDCSVEICGGPHVKNTGELGHFKIIKEEASSSGVRRIKAILE